MCNYIFINFIMSLLENISIRYLFLQVYSDYKYGRSSCALKHVLISIKLENINICNMHLLYYLEALKISATLRSRTDPDVSQRPTSVCCFWVQVYLVFLLYMYLYIVHGSVTCAIKATLFILFFLICTVHSRLRQVFCVYKV